MCCINIQFILQILIYSDYKYDEHINSSSTSYGAVFILINGSLFFTTVELRHAGTYVCTASNEYGNDTMAVAVRLDYSAVSLIALHSIIIGFASAAAMFLFAVVIGAIRYACRVCSKKERRKRKSIREVLEGIQVP